MADPDRIRAHELLSLARVQFRRSEASVDKLRPAEVALEIAEKRFSTASYRMAGEWAIQSIFHSAGHTSPVYLAAEAKSMPPAHPGDSKS